MVELTSKERLVVALQRVVLRVESGEFTDGGPEQKQDYCLLADALEQALNDADARGEWTVETRRAG